MSIFYKHRHKYVTFICFVKLQFRYFWKTQSPFLNKKKIMKQNIMKRFYLGQ